MPNILGQNFIAGGRSALGQSLQKSLDATTGEELPYSFHQATDGEIDAAALAAKNAFPEYRQLSPARRRVPRRHCRRAGQAG